MPQSRGISQQVAPPVTVVQSDRTADVQNAHPMQGPIGMCPYHQASGKGDADGLRKVAEQTIAQRVFGDQSFEKAEKVLQRALQVDPADPQGSTNHLLGKTYFLQEKWGDAVKHLEVSLARNPDNADASHLLERAKTNIRINAQQRLGTYDEFKAEDLLAPPALHIREPSGIAPLEEPKRSAGHKVTDAVRTVTGKVLGKAAEGAEDIVGRKGISGPVWTNWDKSPSLIGAMKLARMRRTLNKTTLQSTYDGELVGGQQPGQRRPEWTTRFRTATGAWNTDDPMEGAAGTEFQRQGAKGVTRQNRALDPTLPSPREVSRLLLTTQGERKTAPFLNNLAIAWIQFQTHDWINHRPTVSNGAYQIPLKDDDPLKRVYGVDNLFVPKSAENPVAKPGDPALLNENTHWWDASQIYGSDQATQDRLRTGADGQFLADGKLRIEGDLLPLNPETGVEDSGFTRNWWAGLDMFHTLFVKHHNYICDNLKKGHPDWSSDQLFHTARLINSATLAKIHTVEWTPAILPNKTLAHGMGANWWGLLETMRKPFGERKITERLEPKDPVLGGLVGGERENYGKAYGFSEEFVEVYRLHAGLPDWLDVRAVGDKEPERKIALGETRGAGARDTVESLGMETLLNSFGHQHMGAVVNNNYPQFLQEMSVEGQPVVDIGAVDILRARERGVPPYNEFRRQLLLKPIHSFEDLGCDAATVKKLEQLYGKGKEGVEKLDLLVGTLCEAHRPEHFGFGETLFQIFIQAASRRLQADPFYTERFDEAHYSKEGLEMIEKATLKDILLTHYPELEKTGLAKVNNAFEPWGTTAKDHPEEHPLTAFSEKY